MSSAVGVVFDCSGYDGSLPLHPAIASNKMRASEECTNLCVVRFIIFPSCHSKFSG